ncbi:MAG: two-component system response regulator [Rickettsiales bacterium]|nr:MAG: two-component system response regulator [Rickettsiales bacterium]
MPKVFAIEDNELNLKLFRDLLKIQKCDIILSDDGVGVLETAIEEQPDLILMDIQLGDINGMDLIRDLKMHEKTKHIPIIAITALAMKNDELQILEAGCAMYLAKPVAINDFFKATSKFLNLVDE